MLITKELSPRSQAVKSLEMTVRRALAIIDVFDNRPETAKDWTDCEPKALRNALGDDEFNPQQAILPELWKRYLDRTLHRQTADLAANLDFDSLSKKSRKEIEDGLSKLG